jgi:glycosyltransferase involved in cell wall biosynthesis
LRILIIGKFPPIEGGVAAQTYWLAHALARREHEVHVVTNASGVEPSFRQLIYEGDVERLRCGDSHGIDLRVTTPLAPQSYIPYAAPHVTQLFGLARRVVAEHRCEAILGWYYEPYGVVAALVGQTTAVPVFLRHAGSDLGRLSENPDLHDAHQWALESAAGLLVAAPHEFERRYPRVKRPRLRFRRPALADDFSPDGERLDLGPVWPLAEEWFGRLDLSDDVIEGVRGLNRKTCVEDRFTIGAYGKVGETKGSYCLVDALARLADRDVVFTFITLTSGRRSSLDRYYRAILGYPRLAERTWIVPPLAPWRIPSFLRRCQAVCFLEHDFPITFHGPLIPDEVMACGACLVTTKEVADKPAYRQSLVDRRNAVILADPRDHDDLASRLGELIANPDLAWALGRQGYWLSRFRAEDGRPLDAVADDLVDQMARVGAIGTEPDDELSDASV